MKVQVGTLVAATIGEEYYLESIKEAAGDLLSMDFMRRHKVMMDGALTESDLYWSWPSKLETYNVDIKSVLPVYPCIDIDSNLTTRRITVYKLINHDIISILNK